jgi:hypothetical protein
MLERSGWSQTEAAEGFPIPLSTLNQKIKRLGIDVRQFSLQITPINYFISGVLKKAATAWRR